jgi:hypothetical protein
MARIRTVKPEFFSHEGLASVSPHARLLAIALLQLADRMGRLRWVPMQVHAHAFPYEPHLDMDALAGELVAIGYLFQWQAIGKTWAWIRNFQSHQVITGTETRNILRTPDPPENLNDSEWPAKPSPADGGWQAGNKEQGTRNKEEENNGPQADRGGSHEPLLLIPEAVKQSPLAECWDHYGDRRNRRGKIPGPARDLLAARIKEYTPEQVRLVIDWSHDAPTSKHLRDNDRGKDFTRWSTIFARSNFAKYVEEAEEWADAGRSSVTATEAADHDGWWAENGARWLRDARECSMVWRQTKGEFGVELRTVEDVVQFVHAGGTKQAAREPDVVQPPPPVDWLRPKVTPLALEIPWVEA